MAPSYPAGLLQITTVLLLVLHINGQGLKVSDFSALGAASATQALQKLLLASKAWKSSYKARPAAACSGTRATGNLCAASAASADEAARYAQLQLATSPAVYSSKPVNTAQAQKECNACTAFAVIAAAEAAIATVLKLREPATTNVSFSAQDFFFCDESNVRSCSMGWSIPEAIAELQRRRLNLTTSKCLPYMPDFMEELRQDELCAAGCTEHTPYAKLGVFGQKRLGTMAAIQQHIRQYGAAVARFDIYSDLEPFFAVKSNAQKVYSPTASATFLQHHAVTLIGYNNEQGWWLCLNSWGPEWADNGKFRVAFGAAAVGSEVFGVTFTPPEFKQHSSCAQAATYTTPLPDQEGRSTISRAMASEPYFKPLNMSALSRSNPFRQGNPTPFGICAFAPLGQPSRDPLCAALETLKDAQPRPVEPYIEPPAADTGPSVDWPALMLNATPISAECYEYTAAPGDFLSMVAWRANIPLEKLLLDNVGRISDLDAPLAGKKLLLCSGSVQKPLNMLYVQLYILFQHPGLGSSQGSWPGGGGVMLPAAEYCYGNTRPPPAISGLRLTRFGRTGLLATWDGLPPSACVKNTFVSIEYKFTPEVLRRPSPMIGAILEASLPARLQLNCCLQTGIAYVLRAAAQNAAGTGPIVEQQFVYGNSF